MKSCQNKCVCAVLETSLVQPMIWFLNIDHFLYLSVIYPMQGLVPSWWFLFLVLTGNWCLWHSLGRSSFGAIFLMHSYLFVFSYSKVTPIRFSPWLPCLCLVYRLRVLGLGWNAPLWVSWCLAFIQLNVFHLGEEANSCSISELISQATLCDDMAGGQPSA